MTNRCTEIALKCIYSYTVVLWQLFIYILVLYKTSTTRLCFTFYLYCCMTMMLFSFWVLFFFLVDIAYGQEIESEDEGTTIVNNPEARFQSFVKELSKSEGEFENLVTEGTAEDGEAATLKTHWKPSRPFISLPYHIGMIPELSKLVSRLPDAGGRMQYIIDNLIGDREVDWEDYLTGKGNQEADFREIQEREQKPVLVDDYTSTGASSQYGNDYHYFNTEDSEQTTTDAIEQRSGMTPETTGSLSNSLKQEVPCDELCGKPPLQVGSVRGIPGEHFPDYDEIPITSFSCADRHIPGFYADLETGCQVFHVCYPHHRESFLCPIGTTFNQGILACDYWYSSNCSHASSFYPDPFASEDGVLPGSVESMIDDLVVPKSKIPKVPSSTGQSVTKSTRVTENYSTPQGSYTTASTVTKGSSASSPTKPKIVFQDDKLSLANPDWALLVKFLPVKSNIIAYPELDEIATRLRPATKCHKGKPEECQETISKTPSEILSIAKLADKVETRKFVMEKQSGKTIPLSQTRPVLGFKAEKPEQHGTKFEIKTSKKFTPVESFKRVVEHKSGKKERALPQINPKFVVKPIATKAEAPQKIKPSNTMVKPIATRTEVPHKFKQSNDMVKPISTRTEAPRKLKPSNKMVKPTTRIEAPYKIKPSNRIVKPIPTRAEAQQNQMDFSASAKEMAEMLEDFLRSVSSPS